jgi:GntR family transcriptional regulator
MLDRESGVPLYVQLRDQLRSRLHAAEWREDDALPTEDELLEQFKVSRATVRRALGDLVHEGLIVRRAGLGTYPRQPEMLLRMERFLSFSDDLRRRGLQPGSRLIGVKVIDTGDVPEELALEFGSRQLIDIVTVRLAAGRPVVIFNHQFPADRFGFLLDEPLDDPELSFYELIVRRHGITYSNAAGEITAVEATDDEAQLLEIPSSGPRALIELRTRTYDDQGLLVEYSRAVVRTDRYALTFGSDWGHGSSLG